ncbi:MAG TPA: hypothetical protein VF460_05580 [Burkholderiales bacterium]
MLALIVAGVVYAGWIVAKTKRDNAEAAAYVGETVAAMAANWDSDELLKRAAPEWLSPVDRAGIKAMFERFAALGKLKALHVPAGRVGNGAFPGTRINGTWADYAVVGEFDAGPSEFRMILKRVDQGWQITGLQVASEALARKK